MVASSTTTTLALILAIAAPAALAFRPEDQGIQSFKSEDCDEGFHSLHEEDHPYFHSHHSHHHHHHHHPESYEISWESRPRHHDHEHLDSVVDLFRRDLLSLYARDTDSPSAEESGSSSDDSVSAGYRRSLKQRDTIRTRFSTRDIQQSNTEQTPAVYRRKLVFARDDASADPSGDGDNGPGLIGSLVEDLGKGIKAVGEFIKRDDISQSSSQESTGTLSNSDVSQSPESSSSSASSYKRSLILAREDDDDDQSGAGLLDAIFNTVGSTLQAFGGSLKRDLNDLD
ncbi:hypothetical protein EIP91_006738 [Steccherinum ochraceum]|uniref:Uncharacterized protein n=1 Tax=Steccherinum ochraceum TaxID=92696 RepID=A0A4R0R573_9APHY|nr:hypothetical protein EIP91_006738 [Steccherinum ochraceum]